MQGSGCCSAADRRQQEGKAGSTSLLRRKEEKEEEPPAHVHRIRLEQHACAAPAQKKDQDWFMGRSQLVPTNPDVSGVGPDSHWLALRLRAGFIIPQLFARVVQASAMESGLIGRLAPRLGLTEPDVLR